MSERNPQAEEEAIDGKGKDEKNEGSRDKPLITDANKESRVANGLPESGSSSSFEDKSEERSSEDQSDLSLGISKSVGKVKEWFGGIFSKDEPGDNKISGLRAKMTVPKDALYYKMDHRNRGIAIIFNHTTFDDKELFERNGTDKDSEALQRSFRKLGFKVHVYNDLTSASVVSVLDKASRLDHIENDCFLLVVLSHGEENYVYARDQKYETHVLWDPFAADKCPSLAGKPKLFVIQACRVMDRVPKFDGGITLLESSPAVSETDVERPSYKIPVNADFLIAYATSPGYNAFRRGSGSWYIQALCQQLDQRADSLDLLTLLVRVNLQVATQFESRVPADPAADQKKQMPIIACMLTRSVRLSLTSATSEESSAVPSHGPEEI